MIIMRHGSNTIGTIDELCMRHKAVYHSISSPDSSMKMCGSREEAVGWILNEFISETMLAVSYEERWDEISQKEA